MTEPAADGELVDAHHHLWHPARRDYPWLAGDALAPIRHRYSVSDLREQAERSGVTGTVLVQTVPSVGETVEFLALAAASGGLIRGVVGWLDLTGPAVPATVAALRDCPGGELLVGIRHQAQDEPDPDWLARPEVLRGIGAVADAGLVYDLLVFPHQLASAITAVRALPAARFVLDHAAKPPIARGEREPWARQLAELAGEPNVACKLSGLVTEADWKHWQPADIRPYAEHVLACFGPDRVMFGSDWPVCELAAGYAEVVELAGELCAGLGDKERAAVFGNTVTRHYNLVSVKRR